jgi:hypothetical protein
MIFAIIYIILMLVSFSYDFQNTIRYGGIDLRTRVVGTRVFLEKGDPYFFSWHAGMSDTLLDPQVKPNSESSRLTITPSILLLHIPFIKHTYFQQKILWLLIQWISFIAIIFIFLSQSKSANTSYLICLISLFFAYSFFWRLHVERSQVYIIYTCLLSISWLLYEKRHMFWKLISGLIIGFTICLRPPALLILLPFVANRRWSMITGSIPGGILGVLLPILISGISIWNSYFLSVKHVTSYLSDHRVLPETNSGVFIPENAYPKIIEGLNFVSEVKKIPEANSSIYNILMNLKLDIFYQFQNLMLLTLICLSFALFIKISKKKMTNNLIFLQGIVAYLILEFLTPSPRYSYNDVQWILPVLIIVNEVKTVNFFINRTTILLIASLLMCLGAFTWVPKFMLISILLMTLYVTKVTYDLLKG